MQTPTLAQIEDGLAKGLALVSALAPLAGLAGPAGVAAGAAIGAVADAAAKIVKAVESDATIIAGGDPTTIRALQAQIQAQNDQLSSEVDAS